MEAELAQVVEVLLTETDTRWMLDLPTALVSTEAEEAARVLERNKIYTELCEAKIDSEYFEEKIVQTFSGAAKTKEVQCEPITVAEKGVVVTPWDLDHPLDAPGAEPAETEGAKTPAGTSSTSLTAGAVPSATDSAAPARSPGEQECPSGAILTSAKLQQDLVVMERILMENIFQPQLAVYRQIPVLIGLSLLSTLFPARNSSFSTEIPHFCLELFFRHVVLPLLICDLPHVFFCPSASLNKHKGPVWQLKWVEQEEGDKEERLMCISGDGRMTQWFIQQRLDCSDVMQIKRTESEKKKLPGERERKSEGPISQQAAGMCFDFHPKDTDIFLAGTEEGHIYCCSCSGKEQILGTYRGHEGPVYKVAWNPSSTDMFLSCSADWSILLWHRDSHAPLLTFTSVTAVVHDIKWAPHSALIFAAVNEERVEIWDLRVSIFDPVLCCAGSPEGTLSSLLFATNAECLLLGDSRGQVGVWLLPSLPGPSAQQVGSLYDIVAPAGAVKQ
nr:WD repeat-containing protein 78 [Zonotrichia albicollis]